MTTPAGQISFNDINVELGRTSTSQLSIRSNYVLNLTNATTNTNVTIAGIQSKSQSNATYQSFTAKTSPGTGTNWKWIYNITGDTWVIGGSDYFLTTTDAGATWSSSASPAAGLYYIAYGNGIYVAGGVGGYYATSTDGLTWTDRTAAMNTFLGFSFNIGRIVFANGKFVAGVQSGYPMYSTDGITWTRATSGTGWGSECTWDGTYFYLSSTANTSISRSSDGVTWTSSYYTAGASGSLLASNPSGTLVVIESSNRLARVASNSGTLSTGVTIGELTSNVYYAIHWIKNQFWLVETQSNTNKLWALWTSVDGVTWTKHTLFTNDWGFNFTPNAFQLSLDGTTLMVAGTDGYTRRVWSSP